MVGVCIGVGLIKALAYILHIRVTLARRFYFSFFFVLLFVLPLCLKLGFSLGG